MKRALFDEESILLHKQQRSDNTQITFQIKSPINKRFRFIFVNTNLNLIHI